MGWADPLPHQQATVNIFSQPRPGQLATSSAQGLRKPLAPQPPKLLGFSLSHICIHISYIHIPPNLTCKQPQVKIRRRPCNRLFIFGEGSKLPPLPATKMGGCRGMGTGKTAAGPETSSRMGPAVGLTKGPDWGNPPFYSYPILTPHLCGF